MRHTDNPLERANIEALLEQAHGYAVDYVSGVHERPVFPSDAALEKLQVFDEPLPPGPSDAARMLQTLHEIGSPATVAQIGGRYFGFVNGGVHPQALAAKWLSDVWDQNTALHVMSPIAARLESVCESWLTELFGFPEDTAAGFVSGSSSSIFCGLAAARNELLTRMDWDVNARGLFGAPEIRVVLGEQAHAAVFKALALLGLGKDRVEWVPVDAQGRMRADRLPTLDAHTLVITQAGNVASGAFDPFAEICARAREGRAWVHVDGAFGLWAAASKRTYPLYAGAELADSWSVDAHKTLNTPYDSGIVFCRHRSALVSALQASAPYIQSDGQRDGMLYTPEMSRRARAVELWAVLKTLGRSGVADLIDQLCARARYFAEGLAAKGFRILNDVAFNQVLVACETADATQAVLKHIQNSGECWCGGTTWNGEPVIRISVCSWTTSETDIDRSVEAFVAATCM